SGRSSSRKRARLSPRKVSRKRRRPSAKIVSKASELLPDPLGPVMTVSRSRGMSTDKPCRLCVRAPRILIHSPESLIDFLDLVTEGGHALLIWVRNLTAEIAEEWPWVREFLRALCVLRGENFFAFSPGNGFSQENE